MLLLPIITFFDSVEVSLFPALFPIITLWSPVVNPSAAETPITVLFVPPASKIGPAPKPITRFVVPAVELFKKLVLVELNDPVISNDPDILASPVNE